ncbi:MAG: class I SAM-dependent methyltransferase [Bryobacteraceae bacterium]
MSNPWLSIPLSDYEGHMESAGIQQASALSELFGEALVCCRPRSIAVLGVAGGNGIDRVDGNVTKSIVGVDVNPLYLEEVRRRYADKRGLELYCVDLAEQAVDLEPVELVHAALVFEHAGVDLCLKNALSLVAPGGALSVVLQLPSELDQDVGASQFPSMQKLKCHFTLIDPTWLCDALAEHEFRLTGQARRSLPAGKGFWMGVFRRP